MLNGDYFSWVPIEMNSRQMAFSDIYTTTWVYFFDCIIIWIENAPLSLELIVFYSDFGNFIHFRTVDK